MVRPTANRLTSSHAPAALRLPGSPARSAPDATEYRLLSREGIRIARLRGPGHPEGRARGAEPSSPGEAFHGLFLLFCGPRICSRSAAILDDPEASDNDRYVALTLLKNAEIAAEGILPLCQDTGTAAIFAKKGQRVWTGANDAEWLSPRRLRLLHAGEPPLFPGRGRSTCGRRSTPAPICRPRSTSAAVAGLATSSSSSPKAAARPTRSFFPGDQGPAQSQELRKVGRPEAPLPRHLRLPALSSCLRHRRNQRRGLHEDAQAGLHPIPRRPAHDRQRARPGLPRPRVGGEDPADRQEERHRRPVRRQILRARRPRRPPAPPRGQLPGGNGRLLQRRPQHQGQDHPRTGFSWSSWRPSPAASSPPSIAALKDGRSSQSTSTARWRKSWPSFRAIRSRPGSP